MGSAVTEERGHQVERSTDLGCSAAEEWRIEMRVAHANERQAESGGG